MPFPRRDIYVSDAISLCDTTRVQCYALQLDALLGIIGVHFLVLGVATRHVMQGLFAI